MIRALLCALPIACASTPPATTFVTKPAMCAEPVALTAVTEDILTGDPLAPNEWRRGVDPFVIDDGGRRYLLNGDGAIAAFDNGTARWSIPMRPIAGGAFGVMLSPSGRIIVRSYSRGGLELFDANNGRLLREVGDAVPSPDDDFVLEIPHVPFGLEALDHNDVRFVPLDPSMPIRSIARGRAAAICATGTILAISSETEVAIYRTTDLKKLASSPATGKPTFTRSGRYLAVGNRVFAL